MNVLDFNSLINQLLEMISKEQKQIFLHGDPNINLLNYSKHYATNEFLDSLASKSIIPYILQPRRLISSSKTLIDNILSNILSWEAISGNIIATKSDHLPVFCLFPMCFQILYEIKYPGKRLVKSQNEANFILITLIKIGLKFSN